jgi:threonine/homoserine/homoserine lactone efflux protein
MILEAAFLIGLGLSVGLSGALIPGPLLVYTINESLKKGRWTGLQVILGHAIVEVFVVILLAAGLSRVMSSEKFFSAISLLGGGMLIYMGARSLKEKDARLELKEKVSYGLIFGGSFFTAFNPSFPLWWATAGVRLLMEGYMVAGFLGVGLVVAGHWLADFGWYAMVSHIIATKARLISEKGWYKKIRTALSLILIAIGAYFLSTVF